MTLWSVLTWSCLRTVVVATLAVGLSRRLRAEIQRCQTPLVRQIWLVAALVPLLVPELVVGFTYRLAAQQLTNSVWGTELLYVIVLLLRSVAVSTLILQLLPRSPVSAESLHAWNLLADRSHAAQRNRFRLLTAGPWRSSVAAWCLTALITFQDFETAALIQVDQHPVVWTVWLFDANAGNQLLGYSLKLATAPLLIELLLLAPAFLLLRSPESHLSSRGSDVLSPARSTGGSWLAGLVTVTVISVLVGGPLILSLQELATGARRLAYDMSGVLAQQTATLGFSAGAAVVALSAARLLRRWGNDLVTWLCLLPGLAGPLILSLTLLWLFQQRGLVLMWDTWLPLLLGQSLLLLPRAWVLLLVLESTVSAESVHSARLLLNGTQCHRAGAWRLLWKLSHAKWLLAAVLLCHWCSWDVTTASILRPVTVEPVVTRLYREMHFSRTESLTALSIVTVAFPFLFGATSWLAARVVLFSRMPRRNRTGN